MVAITITKEDLETLFVRVALSGLTAGDEYDVYRLQLRYLGKDDAGTRRYERELPDRRGLWSSVAHRIGWTAPATTASFRDFECPMRPTSYFVCRTDVGAPTEWDFGDGKYPLSRGVLDDEVVHFNQDLRDANLNLEPSEGRVLLRSTDELSLYAAPCVVEMQGPTYTARGTELAVMGSQYPVFISDTREARRGSVTVLCRNLGVYNDVRRIIFPASGRIRPFIMNGGGDATLLLDDMRCIALDVELEQVTETNPDYRYLRIDYVEVDPNVPLIARTGDNDVLSGEPQASFVVSDPAPARGEWVTLTDTSSGTFSEWEWTVERGAETDNKVGKFYTQGPHRIRWERAGEKTVKLRVYGGGQGAHTRTKVVTVH